MYSMLPSSPLPLLPPHPPLPLLPPHPPLPTSAKTEVLYLSDVYTVAQGTPTHHSHTPLTPRSPVGPPTSSSATNHTHPPRMLAEQKLKRRSSTLSLSSVDSRHFFTLYALKSRPNSIGELFKITFRCPSPEVAQAWTEQITHQMQSELQLFL